MNQGTVKKVYETFWGQVHPEFRAAGVVARSHFDVKKEGTSKVKLDATCYLAGCRWKPKSNQPIDVLIRSTEVYAIASEEMCGSTVRVSYLRKRGEDSEILLPIHYDFDQAAGQDHPVFHAQLGSYKFEQQELDKVQFRGSIMPIGGEPYGNVRIPTACMNFGSTVLGITADHFPSATFAKIIKILRASDLAKWNAQSPALKARVATASFFPSHHWYPA
ncbi:MAG: hypothetical protein JSR47_15560 [Proteobacteria bacterium]|nr:hypothetical protein [Pseudomonadota bacterium]